MTVFIGIKFLIPRHIGGLENSRVGSSCINPIPRHIGGLEKRRSPDSLLNLIPRHIGGLEI